MTVCLSLRIWKLSTKRLNDVPWPDHLVHGTGRRSLLLPSFLVDPEGLVESGLGGISTLMLNMTLMASCCCWLLGLAALESQRWEQRWS